MSNGRKRLIIFSLFFVIYLITVLILSAPLIKDMTENEEAVGLGLLFTFGIGIYYAFLYAELLLDVLYLVFRRSSIINDLFHIFMIFLTLVVMVAAIYEFVNYKTIYEQFGWFYGMICIIFFRISYCCGFLTFRMNRE